MIVKICMRNLLITWKISPEIFFWKIGNFFPDSNFFLLEIFFFNNNFFRKYFSRFFGGDFHSDEGERSELRGGVGERSEPSAGGLTQPPKAATVRVHFKSEFYFVVSEIHFVSKKNILDQNSIKFDSSDRKNLLGNDLADLK